MEVEDWDKEIADLEVFFENVKFPDHPFKLQRVGLITDCETFVKEHMEFIKANRGKSVFLPYFNRLKRIMLLLNI